MQSKRLALGILFFSLAVIGGVLASVSAAEEKKEEKLFDFRETTLDNGLRVITLEDFTCPLVNVQLWYHVGSKDEDPGRQGFAHMFEHMMFRGTERLGPTDHFDYIRSTGGTCNAYTSFDQTVYHETLAAHQLELALWLEAERMASLRIDQNSFDTERKVVEEERRMGLNRPFGSVPEQVMAGLFSVHPYRWTPIGKIPHLRASAVSELRDFWMQYYVPNNATLVIAGAVKHDEALQLAKRHFGWIPRGEDPKRVDSTEPPLAGERKLTIDEKNAPAPLVGIVARTTSLSDKDYIPLQLLARILVGDESSRLYRELVANKKLAVETFSFDNALEQDGIFAAVAVLNPLGGKPDEALAAIDGQLAALRKEPPSERELTKARNQMLKEIVGAMLTVEGKATLLGQSAVLEGDASRVNQRLAAIRDVKAEDLLRVAQKYFAPDQLTVLRVPGGGLKALVQGGGKTDAEENAPITAKPETDPPPPGRPGVARPGGAAKPPIAEGLGVPDTKYEHETTVLENGLKVVTVSNHEVPLVSYQLALKAGAWTEEKPGTASLALQMLTKGTEKHSEPELADELGTYAITLSGGADMDSSEIGGSCLPEQLPRALGLLAEVVEQPTFPADEFKSLQQRTVASLRVQERTPTYLADRELNRRLFGEHPYARETSGEVADVEALAVDDLSKWWKTRARPDEAVLYLAGDIDQKQAVELARKALGDWKAAGEAPKSELPKIAAPEKTEIFLVDDPGSTQSQIRVGQLGIMRDHPGYPTSRVVSGYFGGAFNSRLNETIRVKRGLTYGARGGLRARRFAGDLNVSTFSKTETTAAAVQAVLDELKRLRDEAPSAKELDDTKSYILGSFPLDRETPQQMAADLWLIELMGLPENYLEQNLASIAKTEAADCTKLATEVADPEKVVIVVVGKADAIQKDLEKIAPVTVVKPS